MPVHECSSIVDLWPCHTLTGVGSRIVVDEPRAERRADLCHKLAAAAASVSMADDKCRWKSSSRVATRGHVYIVASELFDEQLRRILNTTILGYSSRWLRKQGSEGASRRG
jgi:hypothetical protein